MSLAIKTALHGLAAFRPTGDGGGSRRHVLYGCLAVVLVLGIGACLESTPLLRSAARLWIVSDDVSSADAVVVLGGGVEDRPSAAAEYYKRGLVEKVLISNVRQSSTDRRIGVMSDVAANYQALLALGVPERDIEIFGDDLSNTHQEALALRDWIGRTGLHSVIVPTEIFSARRLSWTLHRVLGNQIVAKVPALQPPRYDGDDWWQNAEGRDAFQKEVAKYLFYRARY